MYILNAGITRRKNSIRLGKEFCNGQVGELLDPTERSAHFDIVDGTLVVHTMHAHCLNTCIYPLGGVISDFSVENPHVPKFLNGQVSQLLDLTDR